jgi:hypothetical protein
MENDMVMKENFLSVRFGVLLPIIFPLLLYVDM